MTTKNKRKTHKREDLIDTIIDKRINKGESKINIMYWLQNDKKLSQSYSYELMRDAQKEINDLTIINFGDDLKEDIARWEAVYEQAMADGDRFNASNALKEIGKLKGHYIERSQVDIKGEVKIIIDYSNDD